MRRARRNHAAGFKAKVALAALKGDKTLAELAQEFDLHANQIVELKQQMQERAAEVFGVGAASRQPAQPGIKVLHAKIGQLTLENDFLIPKVPVLLLPKVPESNYFMLRHAQHDRP
jgi:transposase